ncbi:MATE family efflux transporter [Psychromonas sp. 14N.309.X.WAT.B.A12]|uniref:MATE family efflux transporter n=1 Tax=Psychromonas sp. 14N.309.X.WAT.B.A12 TaxID=2998322 RepID=UPI0025AEFCDB|nr:MATE family efflux transporter [Psychromonas sp. 14N.309.X.WAT.B.A12]MDN2663181.1 MATE family efflux transporter [Psychromonas sp. 14N.309.X.WAT.B.A12]
MTSITAKFTQGDIAQHITKMALTNVIGLSVFFMVDLIDIYFISLLKQPHLLSAIAYAAAILFFTTSFTIAMMIANSAVVARQIGQKQYQTAQQSAMTSYLITFVISILLSGLVFCNAKSLLQMIGAEGIALQAAYDYLTITILTFPVVALGMQAIATLRALGKAKIGMYCTMSAGIVNLLLDPLFIFYFDLDIKGAAIASLIARSTMVCLAVYYLLIKANFITKIPLNSLIKTIPEITRIAYPACFTQLATPITHLYVTYEIAKLGADTVAGWAVISRLIPVIFMILFAMPGAIGPIISQNMGAKQFKRVKLTLNHSLNFIIRYVFVVALLLSFSQELIVTLFNATGETASLLRFFCQYICISFIFVAMNLVAMSFLNNVGHPKLASLLNIGKMSLGTIPFVSIGAYYYGAHGILIGQALGSISFAFIAIILCYQILGKLDYN